MSLTVEQTRSIADNLLEAAQVIDEYLDKNFNQITRAEYEFLNESFTTLMRVSSYTTTVAVDLAIDELQEPVNELNDVIKKTKEKIKILQNIGNVIRLVAGLSDLAAGIMAKSPKAIVSSVTSLNTLLQEST